MLVAVAYRASADPFAKVRGMVAAIIAILLQVAAAEATQEASCVEQIGKSTSRRLASTKGTHVLPNFQ